MLSSVFLLNCTERYRERDIADLSKQSPAALRETSIFARVDFSFDFLGPWLEYRAAAHAAPHNVYIKTHEPADDDSRAIYVVRDPRSALVSYLHFQRLHYPELSFSQEDVIKGSIGFGSWSAHLESWQPDRRSGTLLLRYEDMVEHPDSAIAAISNFLGSPPLRPWRNFFGALHAFQPKLYRSGSDTKNVSELTASQVSLVESLHGPWMRRLGYDRN